MLREQETGAKAADLCRKHGNSEATFYSWKAKYGGMEGYDLVIRVNPEPDEGLVGRIFLRDRLVVVASPGLGRPGEKGIVPGVVRGAGDRQVWKLMTTASTRRLTASSGPNA